MRSVLLLFVIVIIHGLALGQPLTGALTIPGDYGTISLAVTDLNTRGVGQGGVTFLVAAGHSETGANIVFTTNSASESSPVVFQKWGIGVNPVITASGGVSASTDGIVKFAGTDYVTFSGIDLLDPATNDTPAERMEWGFAILMASDTNASQHITIANSFVTLQKSYVVAPYSSGVYSKNHLPDATALLVPTTLSGVVSYCKIDNCIFSDVIYGINWTGAAQVGFYGNNNCFGTGGGNTVTNFGGSAVATYGIYAGNQQDLKIFNNQITGGDGTTSVIYGIHCATGINSSVEIVNNKLTLTTASTTGTTYGVYNAMGGSGINNIVRISGNSVTINNSAANSGILYGIYQSAGAWFCAIDSNTVADCLQGGGALATASGTFAGIYSFGANSNPGSTWRISANTIRDNVRIQRTRGGGNSYGIYNSSSGLTLLVSGNLISDNNWPSGGSSLGIYITNSVVTAVTVVNNTVNNIIKPGALNNTLPRSGTLYGIYLNATAPNGVCEVHDNSVSGLSNSWGGQVLAFRVDGGTSSAIRAYSNQAYDLTSQDNAIFGIYNGTGKNVEVYRNKVYQFNGVTGDSASFYGICTSTSVVGSVSTVYNNYISDLNVSEASAFLSAGLYCSGTVAGTLHRYYNNTVYLDNHPVSGSPVTSAIYANVLSNLDLRNNILVNRSQVTGGGKSVVFWRSGIDGSSYSTSSNFNCLYGGEPGPGNLLYYGEDPSAPQLAQNLTEYMTIFPQESQSFAELPPFININSKPYLLEISDTAATACESGGSTVESPEITNDHNAVPRYPNTGYPENADPINAAFAPDCGAFESGGIPLVSCSLPEPGSTLITANNLCMGEETTVYLQNTVSGTGITYQWQTSADGVNYSDIPGANGAFFTFSPDVTVYCRCAVTCHNGPVTGWTSPVLITFVNGITNTLPGRRCEPGAVELQATAGAGNLQWYAVPAGGSAAGTGSSFITPVIDTTTSYYVESVTPVQGIILGTGGLTSTGYESPFYHFYGGKKSQYLVHASELIALGLSAGNISSLSFEVVNPGTSYYSFNIALGTTTMSSLTTTLLNGLSGVYAGQAETPSAGICTYNFTTPFYWDGLSNLIVETCWSNSNTGGSSCTVKYDLVGFTAQSYYRADNLAAPALCASVSASATMNSRPKMYFNYLPECRGPRVPVVATVYPLPPLTISGGKVLCPGEIYEIGVTSELTDFESYTWSPVANLYFDNVCTIPYTPTLSAAAVYVKSDTAFTASYRCLAENSATTCSASAETTISVLPDPVMDNSAPEICFSGESMLALSPDTGYLTAAIQWLESPDGLNFSAISGATNTLYTTPVLTESRYYQALVSKAGGEICTQLQTFVEVLVPEIVTTTAGSRCGSGTVLLEATGTPGSVLNWYQAPTGGTPAGTGEFFTTPVISDSTVYYVSAGMTFSSDTAGVSPAGCETPRIPVMAAVNPPPAVSVVAHPLVLCSGDSSWLTVSSTNAGYSYTWNPGGLSGDSIIAVPSETTSYTVVAWDTAAGCGLTDSVTITVNELPGPVAVEPAAPEIIRGDVQRLVATGGLLTPGLSQASIFWSPYTDLFLDSATTIPYNGTATDTIYAKPFSTATYFVTAMAPETGCSVSNQVTIITYLPCEAPYNVVASNTTQTGTYLSWAAPTYIPVNGYEFEIRHFGAGGSGESGLVMTGTALSGQNELTISGLNPNTMYHAYLRSSCGDNRYSIWSADLAFTTLPNPPVVSGTPVNITCNGVCNGSIVLHVINGLAPFTYLWSNDSVVSDITGLCAGTYSVTVTDAVNQTGSNSWIITEPGILTGTLTEENVTCYGTGDGVISLVNLSGGTAPYAFVWSTGATDSSIINLSPGDYSLTITDAAGCTEILNGVITEPDSISIAGNVVNVTCPSTSDGGIQTGVSGGTPGYTYIWSNGAITPELSGLTPGLYTVTVTDISGCLASATFTVGQNSLVCPNISVAGVIPGTACYDATHTITVAGGGSVFEVQATGHVNFLAGVSILFKAGTKVIHGGYLHGQILPTGPFCSAAKIAEVIPVEASPEVTDLKGAFILYPNPTPGDFTIVRQGKLQQGGFRVEVFSLKGERLWREEVQGMKKEIRFSGRPAGVYMVRIWSEEGVVTKKLVVSEWGQVKK